MIRKEYPDWTGDGYICIADLNRFRIRYAKEILEQERAELASLEETASTGIPDGTPVARNINEEFDQQLGFGERISGRFADFAGSGTFIALFTVLFGA